MSDSAAYDQYATAADLYDGVPPYRERTDVAFFVDAATAAGSPILEIGCGTGRVLLPTARAGLDIVGLDASPRMLAVCRERLQSESAQAKPGSSSSRPTCVPSTWAGYSP
jgi:SAM-dependent methyltransferase